MPVFTSTLTFYPLPQERKQLQADSDFADDRPANPIAGFSMRRQTILLLLGEKAGMREDVTLSRKCRSGREWVVGNIKRTPRDSPRGVLCFQNFSGANARQFLVIFHVHNLELFGMHAGVGAEGQLAEVAFFHLDEMFFVLGAEPVEHGRIHHDA